MHYVNFLPCHMFLGKSHNLLLVYEAFLGNEYAIHIGLEVKT